LPHIKVLLEKQCRVFSHSRYHLSIVFDQLSGFITEEMSQCKNIKSRENRQCVESSLKMLRIYIRDKLEKVPENGCIIYFGIDQYDDRIMQIIEPLQPVPCFYYKCDKRFHVEPFEKLFEVNPHGYVVFVDGKQYMIYKYVGNWIRLKQGNALLVKRQRKGGQSALRFARHAEESRHHYISHVVDVINNLIKIPHKNVPPLYLFGSEELKNMLLENMCLKVNFKTESRYYSFDDNTIKDPYFEQLMKTKDTTDIDKKAEHITDLLKMDPDWLLFSDSEIIENIQHLEYVIFLDKPNNSSRICMIDNEKLTDKIYKLSINSKYYSMLHMYMAIGKLFYKNGATD